MLLIASIEKHSDNTYRITVSCGYGANGKKLRKHKTVTLPEGMTERQTEKELQKQAVLFEKEVENIFGWGADHVWGVYRGVCVPELVESDCGNYVDTIHFLNQLVGDVGNIAAPF